MPETRSTMHGTGTSRHHRFLTYQAEGAYFRPPNPGAMPTNGRAAYGPLAERFAGAFEPSDPVVVFDHFGIAEALRDCASRRFQNQTFYVRAVLQREYSLRADAIVPNILAAFSARDDRLVALEQAFVGTLKVNDQSLGEIAAYTPEAIRLMQAALRLADALVVSSESERRRIADILVIDPPSKVISLRDPQVPMNVRDGSNEGDAVVIWAPHLSGDAGMAFAMTLEELRLPILLVSSTAPSANGIAHWVPVDRAAAALLRARLVVDASAYGCEGAISIAAWQIPMITDVEAGAHEHLTEVRTFDRRRMSSIFEAAITALGRPAPAARETRRADPIPRSSQALPNNGPLVSVIIPTLDRPAMLRDALESVRAQTYLNIETLVVVDGGPRLDSLAQEFPDVRFLHMPENNPLHSSNTAFSETTGEYVAFLNDDDLYFPEHVASLVAALEHSGGSVAHGDVLTAFLRGARDQWELYGFENNMSRATSASALLVSNQIGMTSCMFRRSCIADGIPFEEDVPLYRDYALWLRLAMEYDFIHVERLTSCYTIRNDGAQQQSNMWYDKALRSYEVLYERYPVADRPQLAHAREVVLQSVTSERMMLRAQPAAEIQAVRWPLWGL